VTLASPGGAPEALYARIAVARPFGGLWTYAVPVEWAGRLSMGHVVLVPLGKRGAETGYVVDFEVDPEVDPARIKPISRVLDPIPAFTAQQLTFFQWIAEYYQSPLGLVIQTALPSQIRARVVLCVEPTDVGIEALTVAEEETEHLQVLREIIARPGLTRRGLRRRLDAEVAKDRVDSAIDALVRRRQAVWAEREIREAKGRVKTVQLKVAADRALELLPRAGRRQRAIIASLDTAGKAMDLAQLVAEQGPTVRDALRRLAKAEVVVFGEREERDDLADAPALGATEPLELNEDQLAALKALTAPGAKGAFLLHGVTGSGKTEVFLGAARHALDQGKQVLVLVPEIGLTPQLVGRFRARFGADVAVLHSGLTGAERLGQWRRIRAKEARVAVGARSALFAPFSDLGLIVVDEEHDDSYKQEDSVPYHARDLAVVLGNMRKCPVVLASATPSLESYFNGQEGRYQVLSLPRRATPRAVPTVELVDMTAIEPVEGRRPVLAPSVVQALRKTFADGGQAIVLYNRRGFATMVQCTSCGGTWECPNCGITMTLHRRSSVLACHYCNFRRPYSDQCPSCHSTTLEELGKGTERIEEVLSELFPHIAMERMDADTTAVRGSHHRILDGFREGRTQLLVGTQIVAKGHDFPGVHTAVVVSADHGFRIPDFRAAERTFALLIQMAGRAGRGDVPGRVLVQTWKPDHYVLAHLGKSEAFYERELHLRSLLKYPPYLRLVLIRVEGVNRAAALDAARGIARLLRREAQQQNFVGVLGPAAAALPKLVGRWRFQIVLRGTRSQAFRSWLTRVLPLLKPSGRKGVRVAWDVDPRHLM